MKRSTSQIVSAGLSLVGSGLYKTPQFDKQQPTTPMKHYSFKLKNKSDSNLLKSIGTIDPLPNMITHQEINESLYLELQTLNPSDQNIVTTFLHKWERQLRHSSNHDYFIKNSKFITLFISKFIINWDDINLKWEYIILNCWQHLIISSSNCMINIDELKLIINWLIMLLLRDDPDFQSINIKCQCLALLLNLSSQCYEIIWFNINNNDNNLIKWIQQMSQMIKFASSSMDSPVDNEIIYIGRINDNIPMFIKRSIQLMNKLIECFIPLMIRYSMVKQLRQSHLHQTFYQIDISSKSLPFDTDPLLIEITHFKDLERSIMVQSSVPNSQFTDKNELSLLLERTTGTPLESMIDSVFHHLSTFIDINSYRDINHFFKSIDFMANHFHKRGSDTNQSHNDQDQVDDGMETFWDNLQSDEIAKRAMIQLRQSKNEISNLRKQIQSLRENSSYKQNIDIIEELKQVKSILDERDNELEALSLQNRRVEDQLRLERKKIDQFKTHQRFIKDNSPLRLNDNKSLFENLNQNGKKPSLQRKKSIKNSKRINSLSSILNESIESSPPNNNPFLNSSSKAQDSSKNIINIHEKVSSSSASASALPNNISLTPNQKTFDTSIHTSLNTSISTPYKLNKNHHDTDKRTQSSTTINEKPRLSLNMTSTLPQSPLPTSLNIHPTYSASSIDTPTFFGGNIHHSTSSLLSTTSDDHDLIRGGSIIDSNGLTLDLNGNSTLLPGAPPLPTSLVSITSNISTNSISTVLPPPPPPPPPPLPDNLSTLSLTKQESNNYSNSLLSLTTPVKSDENTIQNPFSSSIPPPPLLPTSLTPSKEINSNTIPPPPPRPLPASLTPSKVINSNNVPPAPPPPPPPPPLPSSLTPSKSNTPDPLSLPPPPPPPLPTSLSATPNGNSAPGPPPPPPPAPPPPAMKTPTTTTLPTEPTAIPAPITTTIKLKQIHWDKLENIDGTIWDNFNHRNDTFKELTIDGIFHEIDDKFKIKENIILQRKKKIGSNGDNNNINHLNEPISFLSRDLQQQFGINLHMFSNLKVDEFVLKVLQCDNDIIKNISVLEFFCKEELSHIAPSIMKKYEPYIKSNSEIDIKLRPLERGDEIFLKLCYHLKSYWGVRSKSLLVLSTYEKDYYDLIYKLQKLDDAITQLQNCNHFQNLLYIIIEIGNYMNTKIASGIKISSLNKLIFIKSSVDNNDSFLHFIERIIRHKYPEMMSFIQELENVENLGRITMDQLEMECQEFCQKINTLYYNITKGKLSDQSKLDKRDTILTKIKYKTNRAKTKGDLLKDHLELTLDDMRSLLKYYGEDYEDSDVRNKFFQQFVEFLQLFKKCNKENLEKEAIEKLYKERNNKIQAEEQIQPNEGDKTINSLLSKLRGVEKPARTLSVKKNRERRNKTVEEPLDKNNNDTTKPLLTRAQTMLNNIQKI